jgi:hypothetical protein
MYGDFTCEKPAATATALEATAVAVKEVKPYRQSQRPESKSKPDGET